ncbi:MAG: hypothetical protein JNN07_18355 [Verrucomicrobiales bacterium]|nr:hypothetical protein [Verrucomicrobiales bacterium]
MKPFSLPRCGAQLRRWTPLGHQLRLLLRRSGWMGLVLIAVSNSFAANEKGLGGREIRPILKSSPPRDSRVRQEALGFSSLALLADDPKMFGQVKGIPDSAQPRNDLNLSPFNDYDRVVITAIRKSWWRLCRKSAQTSKTGRVVLTFKLRFDGTIGDLKVQRSEVPESQVILCKRAVLEAGPFKAWTKAMHEKVGADNRPVTMSFDYEPEKSENP